MFSTLFNFSGENLYSALLSFVPAVFNIALLVYALRRLPKDRTTRVFILFLAGLISYQLSDTSYRLSATPEAVMIWDRIFCIGYLSVGPLALHFALCVGRAGASPNCRRVAIAIYATYIFFTLTYLATPAPLIVERLDFWGYVVESRPGTLDSLERYWTSALVLLAMTILFVKAWRARNDLRRKNAMLVIATGLSLPVLLGVLTEVVFPELLSRPEIPLTSVSMTVFSVAVIVALRKYRLFSITDSIPVETVLENLNNYLFIVSVQREVVYVNPQVQQTFGIAARKFSFEAWLGKDSAAEKEFRENVVGNSFSQTSVTDLPFNFTSADGKEWHLLVSTRRIVNNGILQGLLIVARDNAELQLQESEKKYKNLFENNPMPMWVYDIETLRFCDVNPAAIGHYGYSREEFLSMTLRDIVPADMNTTLLDRISRNEQGFNRLSGLRHRKKNGSVIFVEAVSHTIEYGKGKKRLAMINDITERLTAEQKIRKSERLLAKTQQITRIGSWELDVATNRLYWSDELYRIYGLPPQEGPITYEGFWEFMHPDDLEMMERTIKTALKELTAYSCHYRIVRRDGEIRIIHGQGEVEVDEKGAIRLSGVANDVTERKLAEEQLARQNEELTKTNAALDRFVYSASHELRAPLASILGLINVSLMGEDNREKRRMFDMMKSSVEKLDVLIRNIADYSRNSRLELARDQIDFRQLIDGSIRLLYFMNENNRIRMQVDVEGEGEFYSDKSRLEVVLNNFISNAIKYHNLEQADPFIHVKVRFDSHEAKIEVKDNGIGIPAKSLDKVFNIFYRATAVKSGSGLGLYIVKEIIEGLGGKVGVESAEGVGTTFTVTLPGVQKKEEFAETAANNMIYPAA